MRASNFKGGSSAVILDVGLEHAGKCGELVIVRRLIAAIIELLTLRLTAARIGQTRRQNLRRVVALTDETIIRKSVWINSFQSYYFVSFHVLYRPIRSQMDSIDVTVDYF